jgi:hypothetical protein
MGDGNASASIIESISHACDADGCKLNSMFRIPNTADRRPFYPFIDEDSSVDMFVDESWVQGHVRVRALSTAKTVQNKCI